nr:MAG TPA_asm: hypothetical protein [Caudoviricetes sp.]
MYGIFSVYPLPEPGIILPNLTFSHIPSYHFTASLILPGGTSYLCSVRR